MRVLVGPDLTLGTRFRLAHGAAVITPVCRIKSERGGGPYLSSVPMLGKAWFESWIRHQTGASTRCQLSSLHRLRGTQVHCKAHRTHHPPKNRSCSRGCSCPLCQLLVGPRCQLLAGPRCQLLAGPRCQLLVGPRCQLLVGPRCQLLEGCHHRKRLVNVELRSAHIPHQRVGAAGLVMGCWSVVRAVADSPHMTSRWS